MPKPPLITVLLFPRGDHANPSRGDQFTASTPGYALCRPVAISLLYGTLPGSELVTLASEDHALLKFAKQLVWHTGLELRSARRAAVSVKRGVTFQSSCA